MRSNEDVVVFDVLTCAATQSQVPQGRSPRGSDS